MFKERVESSIVWLCDHITFPYADI